MPSHKWPCSCVPSYTTTNQTSFVYLSDTFGLPCWNGCDLSTGWASEGELSLLVSDSQWHQALTTEDMEALEYFGVSVGVQTNGTVELLFYSLETFFSMGVGRGLEVGGRSRDRED